MASLIVSMDGAVVQEKVLVNERTTIGRRPFNDIILDNRAISGEHAVVIRSQHDHILEDLNSTNGTFVNGQPIRKHFLQDNDIIELVNCRIQYVRKLSAPKPAAPSDAEAQPLARAVLIIRSGASAGRELPLEKEATTLGKPGVQLAAILRRPDGYFLQHIEGEHPTTINGQPLGADPHPLSQGDMIGMANIQLEFSQPGN